MADKVVLEAEVKSNIGEVTEDAAQLGGELRIMGVSLNDVKAGFSQMASVAKASFRTVKVGLMSTGIGALVVALGSVITYFTQTEKGAEKLRVIFAGVGAAVSVITDRISKFGSAVIKFFKGDFKQAAKDLKDTFAGVGTELKEEIALMTQLERQTNRLRDSERALSVETAQRRAEIEELKLIAEDVTKSEEERLNAAQKAFDLEQDLLDKRTENAEKAVSIAQQQVAASESSEEDLDNLAQKEIELANIRGESFTKQIELNNKINAIEAETARKREENHQKQMERIEEERRAFENAQVLRADGLEKRMAKLNELEEQNTINLIENTLERERKRVEIERENQVNSMQYRAASVKEKFELDTEYFIKVRDLNKADAEATRANVNNQLSAFSNLAGALSTLAGDNKELAAGSAIIDTYVGANKAFAQGGMAGFLGAAAIIVQGLANVKRIYATDVGSGGGGGAAPAVAEAPAPQMMSGAFELTGGEAPEPLKAFVVTDEMTNSQNQLANIRRRATI
jgi:hypothetical protein